MVRITRSGEVPIPAWPFLHWWPRTKAHALLSLKRIFLGGVVICFLFSETSFLFLRTQVEQMPVYCNFKKKSAFLQQGRRWKWQFLEAGDVWGAVVGQEAVTVILEASSFQGVWCVLSPQQRRSENNKKKQNKT